MTPDNTARFPLQTDESMGFLLHDAARLLRRQFNRRMQEAKIGLTQGQWRILAILARRPGINQKCLSDVMEMQPISVSRLLDRMEAAGWVMRQADATDRRATQLYLTAQAQPFLDKMQSYVKTTLDAALAGVSPADQQTVFAVLQTLRKNLTCDGDKK